MNKASIRVESLVIPTYPEPAKEEMPLFAEYRVHQRSTGRPYPNKATLDVGRQHRQDKTYTVVHMENEYLDVLIMPEIGGKIYAAKDKTTRVCRYLQGGAKVCGHALRLGRFYPGNRV